MTPRLLGGKVLGSLARKVSKFQLDKNRDAYKIGVASASVAYPKSATEPRHSYALDMQMNVDIVRSRRRLGMVSYHSTANRTWPPPSMSASTGCTVRAFSRMSRLPPVRTDKPTLGWESGVTYKLKVCQHCGKEYQPTGPAQKYCKECGPVVEAEKKKVYGAEWFEANPEKRKAFSKAARAKFYRKNLEKVKAWNANWDKEHPAKCAVYRSNRRDAKYANTPIDEMLTSTEWLAVLAEANGHCAYCNKEAKLTLDHVIPLSKGGKHSKENVVPACLHCNDSKGTKTLEEWIGMAVIHV